MPSVNEFIECLEFIELLTFKGFSYSAKDCNEFIGFIKHFEKFVLFNPFEFLDDFEPVNSFACFASHILTLLVKSDLLRLLFASR